MHFHHAYSEFNNQLFKPHAKLRANVVQDEDDYQVGKATAAIPANEQVDLWAERAHTMVIGCEGNCLRVLISEE